MDGRMAEKHHPTQKQLYIQKELEKLEDPAERLKQYQALLDEMKARGQGGTEDLEAAISALQKASGSIP